MAIPISFASAIPRNMSFLMTIKTFYICMGIPIIIRFLPTIPGNMPFSFTIITFNIAIDFSVSTGTSELS